MRREHYGRIIAVGAAGTAKAGELPFDYMFGKTGRSALIKSLAVREIVNGITCNVIAPGHTPHFTMRQAIDAAKHSAAWKRRTKAQQQDVAEAVRFLCSDEAAFVTGSVIELAGNATG